MNAVSKMQEFDSCLFLLKADYGIKLKEYLMNRIKALYNNKITAN